MVRNSTPAFVFSVKSVDVDSRVVKSGQLVNHFGKARNFTTKVSTGISNYKAGFFTFRKKMNCSVFTLTDFFSI